MRIWTSVSVSVVAPSGRQRGNNTVRNAVIGTYTWHGLLSYILSLLKLYHSVSECMHSAPFTSHGVDGCMCPIPSTSHSVGRCMHPVPFTSHIASPPEPCVTMWCSNFSVSVYAACSQVIVSVNVCLLSPSQVTVSVSVCTLSPLQVGLLATSDTVSGCIQPICTSSHSVGGCLHSVSFTNQL